MKLHEVSTVLPGYAFREAIVSEEKGHTYVFQAKDLVQGDVVGDVGGLTKVSQDFPGYSGFLKKNDVLIVARGMKAGSFRAAVFKANEDNVVASSSVYVIRLNSKNIVPEFLSLYLNSKEGQDIISRIVTGSLVGLLSRKALEDINIPILPIKQQQLLTQLDRNMWEQQKIVNRQNKIKQDIINATFKNLIAR